MMNMNYFIFPVIFGFFSTIIPRFPIIILDFRIIALLFTHSPVIIPDFPFPHFPTLFTLVLLQPAFAAIQPRHFHPGRTGRSASAAGPWGGSALRPDGQARSAQVTC